MLARPIGERLDALDVDIPEHVRFGLVYSTDHAEQMEAIQEALKDSPLGRRVGLPFLTGAFIELPEADGETMVADTCEAFRDQLAELMSIRVMVQGPSRSGKSVFVKRINAQNGEQDGLEVHNGDLVVPNNPPFSCLRLAKWLIYGGN